MTIYAVRRPGVWTPIEPVLDGPPVLINGYVPWWDDACYCRRACDCPEQSR